MAILDGGGKVRLPIATSEDELQRVINLFLHTASLFHAFVQALAYSHGEGVIHNDLHPWNIMIEFITSGVSCKGIIGPKAPLYMGICNRCICRSMDHWCHLQIFLWVFKVVGYQLAHHTYFRRYSGDIWDHEKVIFEERSKRERHTSGAWWGFIMIGDTTSLVLASSWWDESHLNPATLLAHLICDVYSILYRN